MFNGSAGTAQSGAAFILKDAWKYPLDLQRQYDDQDARERASQARLAHQDRLAQEKQAAARLDEIAKFDPSGVLPEDQQRILDNHQAMLRQTAADAAAGRNPGNRANAAEYTRMMSASAANRAQIEQSKQYNAERVKQAQLIQGAGIDNPYDTAANARDWDAFVRASPEERLKLGVPQLAHYVDPMKATRIIAGDVSKSMKKTSSAQEVKTGVGSGVKTTTDEFLDPTFIEHVATGLRQYPGVDERFQQEYKDLEPAAKNKYLNYDEFADARAKEYAQGLAAARHEERLTLDRAPQPRDTSAQQRYESEKNDETTAVTSLFREANDLMQGKRDLFPNPVPGHPELLGSDKYLGSSLGKAQITKADGSKQDVDNQVKGIYFNPKTRQLYMATTASEAAGKPMIPVTSSTVLNDLIQPLYTSDKFKGKGDAIQRVARQYMRPGSAEVDFSPLGSPVSEADRAAQVAVADRNTTAVPQTYTAAAATAMQLRMGGNVTAENAQAMVGPQVKHLNTVLDGGVLLFEGKWRNSPKLAYRIKASGEHQLLLKYTDTDPKTHEAKVVEKPITREKLAELVGNSQTLRLGKRHLRGLDTPVQVAAPGTAPQAGATDRATEVTTHRSSSSSASTRFRPSASPAPDAELKIGRGTRFRPGQK